VKRVAAVVLAVLACGTAQAAAPFGLSQIQVTRSRTVTRTAFAAPAPVVAASAQVTVGRSFAAVSAQRAFVPVHAPSFAAVTVQRTAFHAPVVAAQAFTTYHTPLAVQRTVFAAPTVLAAPVTYAAPAALAAPAYYAPGAAAAPSADVTALQQRVLALELEGAKAALRAEFDAKLRALQAPVPLAAPKP
jgi:hypothetical protein